MNVDELPLARRLKPEEVRNLFDIRHILTKNAVKDMAESVNAGLMRLGVWSSTAPSAVLPVTPLREERVSKMRVPGSWVECRRPGSVVNVDGTFGTGMSVPGVSVFTVIPSKVRFK